MKKTIKNIGYIILIVLGWCFIAYLFIGAFIKKKSLHDNAENALAIVMDSSVTTRNGNRFFYKFKVDNTEYIGNWVNNRDNPLLAGDTILIVYDTTNPKNNTPGWRF